MLSGGQQQRVALARALAAKAGRIRPGGRAYGEPATAAPGLDVILGLMQDVRPAVSLRRSVMITHNEEIAQMAETGSYASKTGRASEVSSHA